MEDMEEESKDDGPPGAPAWVLTFADLMSLLLAFFVLLFSFSEMDKAKFKEVGGSMKEAFGVQQEIRARDPLKGLHFIAREFSPGRPDPTSINEIRQETTSVYLRYLLARDSKDEAHVMGKMQENALKVLKALVEELGKLDTENDDDVRDPEELLRKALEILEALAKEMNDKAVGPTAMEEIREEGSGGVGGKDAYHEVAVLLEETVKEQEKEEWKKNEPARQVLKAYKERLDDFMNPEKIEEYIEPQEDGGAEEDPFTASLRGQDRMQSNSGGGSGEGGESNEKSGGFQIDSKWLEKVLEKEISEGMLDVVPTDDPDKLLLRIKEGSSFPSGSARLRGSFMPVVGKIGKVLEFVGGKIVVGGHTDSIPMRGGRFRSNWELSSARAASVVHELSRVTKMKRNRFEVVGYADTIPIETNKTSKGRAKNRRVEIVLRTDEPVVREQRLVPSLDQLKSATNRLRTKQKKKKEKDTAANQSVEQVRKSVLGKFKNKTDELNREQQQMVKELKQQMRKGKAPQSKDENKPFKPFDPFK